MSQVVALRKDTEKKVAPSPQRPICPFCGKQMVFISVGFQRDALTPVWICGCPPITKPS